MDNDIIAERRKIGLALNAGLMDGISAIKAKEGYVWVLDVQTDSFVGGEGLKDSGDGYYYFQEPSLDIAPPVVLPAAIYLTIMEAGAKPTDVILEDSVTIPFSTYFTFAKDFVPLHPQNTSNYV